MGYYLSKKLETTFDEAIDKVTIALQEKGFGVLTKINVKETFRKKLDIDFRKYSILGACNPTFAHSALQAEDKIGTMLPCNVIVQEIAEGKIEVAAVDPIASMQAVENPKLADLANEVRAMLEDVIEKL